MGLPYAAAGPGHAHYPEPDQREVGLRECSRILLLHAVARALQQMLLGHLLVRSAPAVTNSTRSRIPPVIIGPSSGGERRAASTIKRHSDLILSEAIGEHASTRQKLRIGRCLVGGFLYELSGPRLINIAGQSGELKKIFRGPSAATRPLSFKNYRKFFPLARCNGQIQLQRRIVRVISCLEERIINVTRFNNPTDLKQTPGFERCKILVE